MPIRRLRLQLILRVRTVLTVMLLQAPRDWGGGYGRDPVAVWTYMCKTCGYTRNLHEQVLGRAVPFCGNDRKHGRLELDERD